MKVFKDLYDYRELLKTSVKKEIRGKYKGSFLGVLWSFVNPLLMVLVYAIVFPYLMRVEEDNYLIFLITAIIPWNFFTTCINQGTTVILNNANIIKKVYFPREVLPISEVTSGAVNFLISCIIILLFTLLGGVGISWTIIFLPFVVIVQYLLILGIILILSSIEMYIRDLQYIVNFFIMLLFYLTPILYSPNMLPPKFGILMNLNPMTHIIGAYRNLFYYKQIPDMGPLLGVFVVSIFIIIVGYNIFKKLEKGFAEEV